MYCLCTGRGVKVVDVCTVYIKVEGVEVVVVCTVYVQVEVEV